MDAISGLLSSGLLGEVGGLVCSGLCCVLALVLLLAGVAVWTRRGKGGGGPAPAPQIAPTSAAAPAPPVAAMAGPELEPVGADDEDAPTTVLPPSAPGAPRAAPPPLPPRPASPRALPDPGDAPRPAGPRSGPLPIGPAGSPPPTAARSARLDADRVPDIPTLKPGATIIPPDDWDDDAVDEGDTDVTMMMPRPTVPPKRS